MLNDLNPYWKKRLLILAALLVALLFWLCSCNPEKQAARKDEKYINYVNASAKRQLPVVNAWKTANPQDTAVKLIISEPKLITVYQDKLVKDTTGRQRLIDSVKQANEKEIDCGKAATDAFDLGYEQAEKYYLANPIKAKCPPDTTKQIQLTSEIRRWQDSTMYYKLLLAGKDGVISEIRSEGSELKKQNNHLKWYLAGSFLLFVVSHILRSYVGGWFTSALGMFKSKQ